MEEKQPTVLSNGLLYGAITGIALILFSLILFLTDLYLNKTVSWISYLFLVGGMLYGTFEYRKKYSNGFIAYSKAFISCFWIGLFAGILASVYMFVFAKFIHPGFVQELLDQARANIVTTNPNMSDEQVEQAVSISAKFMSPAMMAVWALVAYAAISAVISLVLAFFIKKEDPTLKTTI
jgi:hypothetical protein